MASPSPALTGAAIRKLRLAKGWTLVQLAQACGLPLSTLSRVELGQTRLNYDKLVRLCRALDVDLHGLVTREADVGPPALGRRSLTLAGTGEAVDFSGYPARMPAAELLDKALTPVVLDVTALSLEAHGPLRELPGEAYLMVLEGRISAYVALDPPMDLAAGDSLYFDGRTGYALVNAQDRPSMALLVLDGRVR